MVPKNKGQGAVVRIQSRWVEYGLLLLAASIYGGIFPVNRIASNVGWPSLSFTFMQSIIAALALLAISLLKGRRISMSRANIVSYVVIGGLVQGLPIGLLVHVAPHLDSSVLTLVLCLSPILTLLIGSISKRKAPDKLTIAGMILGILGVTLIAWPGSVLADGSVLWFALALIAPFMFALANNCAVWLRPPAATSIVMATGTLLGASFVVFFLMIVSNSPFLPPTLEEAQIRPLLLASAINAFFFLLFFHIIELIGPARFSLFNYLAVAAGIIWSMIVFGEMPGAMFWLATLLMLAGMHLALNAKTRDA